MERAQATVEYVALVSVALIAACLLVRFATPAERIAREVAHAVAGRHRPAPLRAGRPHGGHGRRPAVHRCLCPYPPTPQFRLQPDD